MDTSQIIDAMETGDVLHIRANPNEYGPPGACLAKHGRVSMLAARSAIKNATVTPCDMGDCTDGQCYEIKS